MVPAAEQRKDASLYPALRRPAGIAHDPVRLQRQAVLVTGSSPRHGAAILEAFAEAGATCLLHYFDDPAGQNRQDADEPPPLSARRGATVHVCRRRRGDATQVAGLDGARQE